jgi:hypothetical protein
VAASALRIVPTAPETREPLATVHSIEDRPAQPALPLDWALPNGLPACPSDEHTMALITNRARKQPAGPLPHPAAWAARMARAVIEVVAGERPATQLARWTSPTVYAEVTARHNAARRHPAGKALNAAPCRKVGSVRVCAVAPGVVETSAVVSGMVRPRAIALRMESNSQRWVVTAFELL